MLVMLKYTVSRCDVAGLFNCRPFFLLSHAETLAELLASFFHHWAVAHDYRSAVVTIRRGLPLTKAEKGWCGPAGCLNEMMHSKQTRLYQ